MQCGKRAAPAVIRGHSRAKIILKEPRSSIRAGEEPHAVVAALPGSGGKKWRHGCPGTLSGEQTAEKIAARAKKGHQARIDGPGIVTGAAVQRGRRDGAAAPRSRQESIDMAAMHLQAATQIAGPRMLMWYCQSLPRTPLAGVAGVEGKLVGLKHQQVLIVGEKI